MLYFRKEGISSIFLQILPPKLNVSTDTQKAANGNPKQILVRILGGCPRTAPVREHEAKLGVAAQHAGPYTGGWIETLDLGEVFRLRSSPKKAQLPIESDRSARLIWGPQRGRRGGMVGDTTPGVGTSLSSSFSWL